MTKKDKMYQRIKQHGEDLNAIFNTGIEPVALCKKLRRLETKAHRLATDYCNGENGVDSITVDNKSVPILKAVSRILKNNNSFPVSINYDARGYALKISDLYMSKYNLKLYQDWGGYGILAPDFSE